MHVDDFIDKYDTDEYVSWFFTMKRFPAHLQDKFRKRIDGLKLFCDYKGKRYRVTGCSRLGDIWLRENFEVDYGYDLRVDIDDCSSWSPKP